MARFSIEADKRNLRNQLIKGCVFLVVSFLLLGLLVHYLFTGEEESRFKRAFYLVFFIQGLISGINYIRKSRFKESCVEITEQFITWTVPESSKTISIDWSDIKWIKQERDGKIMLFRQSSFSDSFLIKIYTEETKREILALIDEYASQKNIRLINFSEPVLAMT